MKPLADHGTTARAKGRPGQGIKGCTCLPCRDAERRYDKRRRYLNATGRTLMVDAAPVAEHLRALFAAGAGWTQLAAASTCSTSTISFILNGKVKSIRRSTANSILAVRPGDALPPGLPVNAIGSIRRVHALMALSHSCKAIYEASGVEHSMISDLVNERLTTVSRHIAERIQAGYRRLAATAGTSARSRNRAARENWAPPAAWDDGTIDDPDAYPDWTGHCGTDRGWWTHRMQNLPACQRCEQAHEQWKQDRKHLPPKERWMLLRQAQAEASSRGRDIAEDGRELLRLGYRHEVAAARLGVDKERLYQEMKRHPEPATDRAAA